MQALAALAFTAMLVAATAAGARLLAAAVRTRRDPELWIGLAVLGGAAGGLLDQIGLALAGQGRSEAAFALQAAARALYVVSGSSLAVGNARIFRRGRPWAAVLAAAILLGLAGLWARFVATGLHSSIAGSTRADLAFDVLRAVPFAWAAAESLAYHRQLVRRLRLGLADPVIAHQFVLWAIASTSMVALQGVVLLARNVVGLSPLVWTPGLLGMSACGLVGAATIYTAFFPPAFYRRRVSARPR